jgi:hypothetical protein
VAILEQDLVPEEMARLVSLSDTPSEPKSLTTHGVRVRFRPRLLKTGYVHSSFILTQRSHAGSCWLHLAFAVRHAAQAPLLGGAPGPCLDGRASKLPVETSWYNPCRDLCSNARGSLSWGGGGGGGCRVSWVVGSLPAALPVDCPRGETGEADDAAATKEAGEGSSPLTEGVSTLAGLEASWSGWSVDPGDGSTLLRVGDGTAGVDPDADADEAAGEGPARKGGIGSPWAA